MKARAKMRQRKNISVRSAFLKRKRIRKISCVYLCVIAGCFLPGCGRSGNPQQIKHSLEGWSRSVDLATVQWHEHRLPDLYLEQLLDAATSAKEKQEQQIKKLSGLVAESLVGETHTLETKIAAGSRDLARARRDTR
jgi:hypothetical protein